MDCPECNKSDMTQKCSEVYRELDGYSRSISVSVGLPLSGSFGKSKISTYSSLRDYVAPPDEPREASSFLLQYLFGFIVAFVLIELLGLPDSMRTIVVAATAISFIGHHVHYDQVAFPKYKDTYIKWLQSWYCRKCGARFY